MQLLFFDQTFAVHQLKDSAWTSKLIGTTSSFIPAFPGPALPTPTLSSFSENKRGGFHSSWLISLVSHYCLMIRFSCATSLIY